MTLQVNLSEAESHLGQLIAKAQAGEDVIITKSGQPVVRLQPIRAKYPGMRKLGLLNGKIQIPDDFNTLASEEIVTLFDGAS
jgi:prevent-host-death family protein